MYRMKKKNIFTIVVVVMLVLLTAGVAFAIVKATGIDKTKTIGSTSIDWKLGCLDENGDFVDSDEIIMTKKHLGLEGLKIEVDKKPGVEVYVAVFDKNGNPLNVTLDTTNHEANCYQVQTSATEKTVWTYAEYAATAEMEGTPAYAIVFLKPVRDVEIGALDIHKYAKQVTISYNR